MTRVCTPVVGVISRDPKGLQQRFQLQKDLILTTPKDVGQHLTTTVIDRMPQPSRLFLALDERPHFIDFCLVCEPNNRFDLIRV